VLVASPAAFNDPVRDERTSPSAGVGGLTPLAVTWTLVNALGTDESKYGTIA
jgi:hypothetical protein